MHQLKNLRKAASVLFAMSLELRAMTLSSILMMSSFLTSSIGLRPMAGKISFLEIRFKNPFGLLFFVLMEWYGWT